MTRGIVGGEVKYSVYCPESGGLYDISAADLRLWTISLTAILKEIQRRFQCPGEPVERIHGLWYLGESQCAVAGFRRQFFFAERMTPEVELALPEGTTQILIIGEENYAPTAKFKDRVFQMHELFRLDDDGIFFDMDRIAERCGNVRPEKKPIPVPKNAKQKSREEMIKDFLKNRMMTLRDAYWTAIDKKKGFTLPRRPSLREIAETIHQKTGNKKIPESTVKRTIEGSSDKELRLLWDNMTNENFIRDYHRRKKRAVIRDDDGGDEEYLSEMFGQTAPEPLNSGFHTV